MSRPTRQERFDAKWREEPTGCWIWTGGREHDYGAFAWAYKDSRRAHRVAWQLYRGEIPNGVHVLHHCDTPLCVNPDHLYLGNNADNVADRVRRGRNGRATGDRHGSRTHPESLPRGEDNGMARFTERQVREMRRLRAQGASYATLARRYSVTPRSVKLVVLRKTWAHVD